MTRGREGSKISKNGWHHLWMGWPLGTCVEGVHVQFYFPSHTYRALFFQFLCTMYSFCSLRTMHASFSICFLTYFLFSIYKLLVYLAPNVWKKLFFYHWFSYIIKIERPIFEIQPFDLFSKIVIDQQNTVFVLLPLLPICNV